jgi:hypothetical protein
MVMTTKHKHVVFLSGPIGVGKTTVGRALASRLEGGFIDGDDHSDPDKPWYSSIRRTSASIVETGVRLLASRAFVVVAYPLGRMTWIYYRRKFGDLGVGTLFVTLRAPYETIVSPTRGREFSVAEHDRIKVMIAEGYSDRPFSDLIVDADQAPLPETADLLATEVRRLVAG